MALTEIKSKTFHYFTDKDDELQGEYKFWDINGQLMQHCFYKDGELQGEYKWWYSNGELQEHSFYKDGKFHGEYKWWYSDGQLRQHCTYKDSRKVIDFIDNPEQYPVTEEDKTVFALKYGSGKWL